MSLTQQDFIDADPAKLWPIARALLAEMVAAVGGASAIAALEQASRLLRREFAQWLNPLEALVRKLLLAEALKHKPPASGKSAAPVQAALQKNARAPRPRAQRFVVPLPGAFAHPPVRLLGLSGLARDIAAARRAPVRREAVRCSGAQRLALRYEALRRVLDNPGPHARRLARRLARFAPDERADHALRLACRPPPRGSSPCADAARDAALIACASVERACDSS